MSDPAPQSPPPSPGTTLSPSTGTADRRSPGEGRGGGSPQSDTRSAKAALITGASEGLGRDLAELFASDGHHVILVARNEFRLNELATSLREKFQIEAQVIVQDLSIPNASQQVFDQLAGKPIDFLINNAGFGTIGRFAKSNVETQLAMIHVNITALTHLTRLILPGMLKRRTGRIMNMASVAGTLPGPVMAVYYASKAYVISFSEALATELAGTGITVTAICPGPTKTEFQTRAGAAESNLFRFNVMTSQKVARIAYNAMMHGRRLVTTGLSNKLLAVTAKVMPRRWTAAVAGRMNGHR
jgi:short-subunit dehydrogenase